MHKPTDKRAFHRKLLAWFKQFQRDLPWRRTTDAYRIWISEIMLQQTRVAAVIPYYERFLKRFPNARTLARAPQSDVVKMWAGLGYYSRARNLQKAAQKIVAKHDGMFPRNLEDALALPGIGAYTAAAVLSIAYGQKLAVLDGNVARVLARLHAIRGDLREPRCWAGLQQLADSALEPREPGTWNQAMMELGATLCTPHSPQCLLCPVTEFCDARRLGLSDSIPEKRKKREPVAISLAAAVLLDATGGTLLLPPPKQAADLKKLNAVDHLPTLLSRMWHFPTISIRKSAEFELPHYLRSVFRTELETEMAPLPPIRHTVTYRDIRVFPFLVRCAQLPRMPGAKRMPLSDLSSVPISGLTRKVSVSALTALDLDAPGAKTSASNKTTSAKSGLTP
jgi:A/G-specific adenine glycosylase